MDGAKQLIADLALSCLPSAFPDLTASDLEELRPEVASKTAKISGSVKGQGDLALPCFVFAKKIKGPPMKTAEALGAAITAHLAQNPSGDIVGVKAAGPYLNFSMSVGFVSRVLDHILSGAYLAPRPAEGRSKVMIEYSQPVRVTEQNNECRCLVHAL